MTEDAARKDDRDNAVRPTLGAIIGLVPFALNYRESRTQTVTDTEIRTVVRRTKFDYVAVPCGVIALLLGVMGFAKALRSRRVPVGLVAIVSATLGVVQIVRGYGP